MKIDVYSVNLQVVFLYIEEDKKINILTSTKSSSDKEIVRNRTLSNRDYDFQSARGYRGGLLCGDGGRVGLVEVHFNRMRSSVV